MYTVHFTVYIVQCTLYKVNNLLYTGLNKGYWKKHRNIYGINGHWDTGEIYGGTYTCTRYPSVCRNWVYQRVLPDSTIVLCSQYRPVY